LQVERIENHRKDKTKSYYERRKTPNLGFVEAKDAFKKDREAAFGIEGETPGEIEKNEESDFMASLLHDRDDTWEENNKTQQDQFRLNIPIHSNNQDLTLTS